MIAATPAFHVTLHMTRPADQALDRVGRGERLAEAIGQPEGDHGEGLVESFADASRGTRVPILEPPRQILQQAPGRRDLGVPIGSRQDRTDLVSCL